MFFYLIQVFQVLRSPVFNCSDKKMSFLYQNINMILEHINDRWEHINDGWVNMILEHINDRWGNMTLEYINMCSSVWTMAFSAAISC